MALQKYMCDIYFAHALPLSIWCRRNIEEREEGGTPDILGAIRLGLTFQLKRRLGSVEVSAIPRARFVLSPLSPRVLPLHMQYRRSTDSLAPSSKSR